MSVQLYRGTVKPNHIKYCVLFTVAFFDYIPKKTVIAPALETRINSVPITKAWWQISPWNARAKNIQYATKSLVMAVFGWATRAIFMGRN